MSALQEIADRGIYDPNVGKDFFFGETCVLFQAAREALREGTGKTLKTTLERLCSSVAIFCQIYGVGDDDKRVWPQGEHLLYAVSKAVLAPCAPAPEIDYGLAKEAAAQFDQLNQILGVPFIELAAGLAGVNEGV